MEVKHCVQIGKFYVAIKIYGEMHHSWREVDQTLVFRSMGYI